MEPRFCRSLHFMVAKSSIWSVRWRIYACLFVSDFTVISLISKLLTLLSGEACLQCLIQALCLGLAMPPVQQPRLLRKRQSLLLLIFVACWPCQSYLQRKGSQLLASAFLLHHKSTVYRGFSLGGRGGDSNRTPGGFLSLLSLGWGVPGSSR